VAEILDGEGFEVETAYSGAEALEILEDHPMDVLPKRGFKASIL